MKILVTGSRHWTWQDHSDIIIKALSYCTTIGSTDYKTYNTYNTKVREYGTMIINGGCKGVDRIATQAAREFNFMVREYPALWDYFGKSAGPKRNSLMLEWEHSTLDHITRCLAFHEDLLNSKGTLDMVKKALAAEIPTYLIVTLKDAENLDACQIHDLNDYEWS